MIRTERLLLRPWRQEDIEPFAKINADPKVMEFFPAVRTYEETLANYTAFVDHFSKRGWGLWAVELPNVSNFIGFIGLNSVEFDAKFTPCVEIGWRLSPDHWGKGYATEGALAALKAGFEEHNLDEIVAFTAADNIRSQAVMKKIGMQYSPEDDFDHPKVPDGHPIKKHVLYRLHKDDWKCPYTTKTSCL